MPPTMSFGTSPMSQRSGVDNESMRSRRSSSSFTAQSPTGYRAGMPSNRGRRTSIDDPEESFRIRIPFSLSTTPDMVSTPSMGPFTSDFLQQHPFTTSHRNGTSPTSQRSRRGGYASGTLNNPMPGETLNDLSPSSQRVRRGSFSSGTISTPLIEEDGSIDFGATSQRVRRGSMTDDSFNGGSPSSRRAPRLESSRVWAAPDLSPTPSQRSLTPSPSMRRAHYDGSHVLMWKRKDHLGRTIGERAALTKHAALTKRSARALDIRAHTCTCVCVHSLSHTLRTYPPPLAHEAIQAQQSLLECLP